jgi:hypothetical protein
VELSPNADHGNDEGAGQKCCRATRDGRPLMHGAGDAVANPQCHEAGGRADQAPAESHLYNWSSSHSEISPAALLQGSAAVPV